MPTRIISTDTPNYACVECTRVLQSPGQLRAHWRAWHDGPTPFAIPSTSVPEIVFPESEPWRDSHPRSIPTDE